MKKKSLKEVAKAEEAERRSQLMLGKLESLSTIRLSDLLDRSSNA